MYIIGFAKLSYANSMSLRVIRTLGHGAVKYKFPIPKLKEMSNSIDTGHLAPGWGGVGWSTNPREMEDIGSIGRNCRKQRKADISQRGRLGEGDLGIEIYGLTLRACE